MNCLHIPEILMPEEGTDLYKWSVVACDQYTSQPEYWRQTEQIVGDAPSTLRLTLPEVYLGAKDEEARMQDIHRTMEAYQSNGTLRRLPAGMMLVQRTTKPSGTRRGLVVEVDLEQYSYKKGEASLIRPTEMTVEERIPPRLKVRQTASIELPHIMLLIDDPERTVIEPLFKKLDAFRPVYDTDLMQEGGHITGWLIEEGPETDAILKAVEQLADPDAFRKKYQLQQDYPLLNLAVGDGNHSMATAKAAWEKIREGLSQEERKTHPARYCLCEIVNIHDESLQLEPIHRVLFGVHEEELLQEAKTYYAEKGCSFRTEEPERAPYCEADAYGFTMCSGQNHTGIRIEHPVWGIAVAALQSFLDTFLAKHPDVKIDYIHGTDVVEKLAAEDGNVGFLLPDVSKEDLFRGVILDGVLPRKTFSMGEAHEKRYYMECKQIKK